MILANHTPAVAVLIGRERKNTINKVVLRASIYGCACASYKVNSAHFVTKLRVLMYGERRTVECSMLAVQCATVYGGPIKQFQIPCFFPLRIPFGDSSNYNTYGFLFCLHTQAHAHTSHSTHTSHITHCTHHIHTTHTHT